MAFDFPNAPVVDEIFHPAGGPPYKWSGSAWYITTIAPILDRLWHPTDMLVKPLIMMTHHDIVWASGSYTAIDFHSIGSWTGWIHASDSCGRGAEAGGAYGNRNLLLMTASWAVCSPNELVQAGPGPAVPTMPAGTCAILGIASGVVDKTGGFAVTTGNLSMAPLEDVPATGAYNPYSPNVTTYWNLNEASTGIYATGSGGTMTPGFKSTNPADRVGIGMHSQFWQLGPVNDYRRDGANMMHLMTTNNSGTCAAQPCPPYISSSDVNYEIISLELAFYAVWDVAPPLADVQILEGWAHWDLGIEGLLPADHPYKAGPPMTPDVARAAPEAAPEAASEPEPEPKPRQRRPRKAKAK
jgi:hypothetical protein